MQRVTSRVQSYTNCNFCVVARKLYSAFNYPTFVSLCIHPRNFSSWFCKKLNQVLYHQMEANKRSNFFPLSHLALSTSNSPRFTSYLCQANPLTQSTLFTNSTENCPLFDGLSFADVGHCAGKPASPRSLGVIVRKAAGEIIRRRASFFHPW